MRKIINSTYISLEGVVERPQEWPSVGDRGPKGDEIQAELLLACDALLMGRRTYEGFAPVWPALSGDPVSDRINSMKKYVVSSTLTDPEWTNTSVISGDPVDEIRRLKEAPGRDIVQYGYVSPVRRGHRARRPPPASRPQRQLRAGRHVAPRERRRDPWLPGGGR
jgi:dihydrofolate reductase